jgi:putative ubiquitin-RnfH superfamily antitoxin RatB of RatAB toxin-antitoxin module
VQIELVRFCEIQQKLILTMHRVDLGTDMGSFLCQQGLEHQLNVGVFGKKASLDYLLSPGDRVEIYEEVRFDPKQARFNKLGKKHV